MWNSFYLFAGRCVRRFRTIIELKDHAKFMSTPFESVVKSGCNDDKLARLDQIDIVSIAYNNDKVIAHQIRLIRKYLVDPWCYTVADNSSDPHFRDSIAALCKQQGISYVGLPANSFRNPSMSHGSALNWIYHRYIKKRSAQFFGFIDHDIYPIRPTRIIPHLLGKSAYGHFQKRGHRWYLWPGFSFFERSATENVELNFLPILGLDTGGGNYSVFYSQLKANDLVHPFHTYGRLREGDCHQSASYECIGDWLHTFNGSYWIPVPGKEDLIAELLAKY